MTRPSANKQNEFTWAKGDKDYYRNTRAGTQLRTIKGRTDNEIQVFDMKKGARETT